MSSITTRSQNIAAETTTADPTETADATGTAADATAMNEELHVPQFAALAVAIPLDEEVPPADKDPSFIANTDPSLIANTSLPAISIPMGGEMTTYPQQQAAVYNQQPQPSNIVHVHVDRREEPCEACASLVLSIIACFFFIVPCLGPIAACVGCCALCKISGNPSMTGRGKAIWGIVLGLAGLVIPIALVLAFGGIGVIIAAIESDGSYDTDDLWN